MRPFVRLNRMSGSSSTICVHFDGSFWRCPGRSIKNCCPNLPTGSALQDELGDAWLQSGKIHLHLNRVDDAHGDFQNASSFFVRKFSQTSDQPLAEKAVESLLAASTVKEIQDVDKLMELEQKIDSLCQRFPGSVSLQNSYLELKLLRASRMKGNEEIVRSLNSIERLLREAELGEPDRMEFEIRLMSARTDVTSDQKARSQLLDEILRRYEILVGSGQSTDLELEHTLAYAETLHERSELATEPAARTGYLEREKKLLERASAKFPGILEFQSAFQNVLLKLADNYRDQGKVDSALSCCQTASELNNRLATPDQGVKLRLAQILVDSAHWHRRNGRTQESQLHLLRACSVLQSVNGDIPRETRQALGQNLLVIGVDQWIYGDPRSARESFVRSESIFAKLVEKRASSVPLMKPPCDKPDGHRID